MAESNRYSEGPAQCAEILRVALPLMTRQAAGVHPVSYAVWFEHASGRNPRLSEAIAAMTQGGAVLNDEQTWRLYRQYVSEPDAQTARKVAEGMRKVMAEMSASAQEAGDQTDRFGDSLARFSSAAATEAVPTPEALGDVMAHTQGMREAMGQLRERLAASQAEIEQLRSEVDRARNEALVDALTGLPNRRAFDKLLVESQAAGGPMDCLLVTDIDHFKRINDSFGHLFGDTVLRVVSQALRACVHPPQMAARVGGEEFAIYVPGAGADHARQLAERIRLTIAGSRIRRKDSQESIGQVTVSLGVAARLPGESNDAWFERADRALYVSKANGRNRVTLADNGTSRPGSGPAHSP